MVLNSTHDGTARQLGLQHQASAGARPGRVKRDLHNARGAGLFVFDGLFVFGDEYSTITALSSVFAFKKP